MKMGLTLQLPQKLWLFYVLARDIKDLKSKNSRITIGYTRDRKPITVADLKVEGALAMIFKRCN